MEREKNVLPADFDGVFRFTNFTETEFKAKWNNIEYTFPPKTMTPMIIPGATPEEVQHIRKKFAKELAIQEFYKSKKHQDLEAMNPKGQTSPRAAVTYVEDDLSDFTKRCLEPLPLGFATAKALPKDDEKNYRKDGKGRNVTKILEQGESLLQEGSGVVE